MFDKVLNMHRNTIFNGLIYHFRKTNQIASKKYFEKSTKKTKAKQKIMKTIRLYYLKTYFHVNYSFNIRSIYLNRKIILKPNINIIHDSQVILISLGFKQFHMVGIVSSEITV